ncbi:MAG: GAF domain-containing protein, partial [Chloroflexi bacterium]
MSEPARGSQARLSETLRLAIVYRLAHELNTELSSAEVLRHVLHAAAAALGTPHASLVALRDRELVAAYALSPAATGDPCAVMGDMLRTGLAGFVLHNYRTVIINDITSNPLWTPLPDEPLSPQEGSALCVPLLHAGEVVGVMTLSHPARGYFTADAVNLTNTISEMGSSSLSNALLLEDARQARQRYQTLFDDAIVPIIITDLRGRIQTVNRRACEFLSFSADELEQMTIRA